MSRSTCMCDELHKYETRKNSVGGKTCIERLLFSAYIDFQLCFPFIIVHSTKKSKEAMRFTGWRDILSRGTNLWVRPPKFLPRKSVKIRLIYHYSTAVSPSGNRYVRKIIVMLGIPSTGLLMPSITGSTVSLIHLQPITFYQTLMLQDNSLGKKHDF